MKCEHCEKMAFVEKVNLTTGKIIVLCGDHAKQPALLYSITLRDHTTAPFKSYTGQFKALSIKDAQQDALDWYASELNTDQDQLEIIDVTQLK